MAAKQPISLDNYWSHDDPPISDAMRTILTQYSGISEDLVVQHVQSVRSKAWEVCHYPTVGLYTFIKLVLPQTAQYPSVIARLKSGETMLDMGCGMGQEIRKMVVDGAPSENIAGADLERSFIESGYILFNDRVTLKSQFYTGDLLGPECMGLKKESFDMINASFFFHLFNWDEQITALTQTVRLLKRRPGSMILGCQFGNDEPLALPHSTSYSGVCFGHSPASWNELLQQVAKTNGLSLNVDAAFGEPLAWMGPGFRWLNFCITLVQIPH